MELLSKSRVHVRDASNSPVYTEQQINDYCEKVLNLCLVARTEGSLMFEGVQIIRQLQGRAVDPKVRLSIKRVCERRKEAFEGLGNE